MGLLLVISVLPASMGLALLLQFGLLSVLVRTLQRKV
jgi:hypothetical protein